MTSRERFEAWALEDGGAFLAGDKFYFMEGPTAMYYAWNAWLAAEQQALERALRIAEECGKFGNGCDVADEITALMEQK